MRKILFIFICFFIVSCSYSKYHTYKTYHTYKLSIKDIHNKPIAGATIDYSLKQTLNKEAVETDGSFVTMEDGVFTKRIPIDLSTAGTILDYKVTADRYYSVNNSITLPVVLSPVSSRQIKNSSMSIEIVLITSVKKVQLRFVDIYGAPIEGAKIEYSTEMFKELYDKSYITKSNGILSLEYIALDDTEVERKFYYKVTKDGYYSESGYVDEGTAVVVLLSPIDYLTRGFAESEESSFLKEDIFVFVTHVLLEAALADTNLEVHSIELIEFKGKKYLTFKFVNSNVYNSLKLSKYDIGIRLFDEVIRKILNPLNEYIGDSEYFYGYDIVVIGHTKDFSDKDVKSDEIEYRFIIPASVVRKYKNKDITGQALLNQSIILMDDERIELELQ